MKKDTAKMGLLIKETGDKIRAISKVKDVSNNDIWLIAQAALKLNKAAVINQVCLCDEGCTYQLSHCTRPELPCEFRQTCL